MGNICKLCNNELDSMKLNGRTLSVETSQWDDYHDAFITKEVEINYCPICGRKLYGKIDYLYYKYKCDDIDTLKARCPIDLKLLDLHTEVTLEFKAVIDGIEEKENESIEKIVRARDKNDNGRRDSLKDIQEFEKDNNSQSY